MVGEKKTVKIFKNDISFGQLGLRPKILFISSLSTMLKSGISLTEALDIIQDQSNRKLESIIRQVSASVQAGNTLADSLAKRPKDFSSFFINTIRAGEVSGTLEESLAYLFAHLKQEQELKEKVKGAMVYPIIVLAISFVIGMILAFVVLPKITPIFSGLDIELPATTRGLIWLADIIESSGVTLFSIILAMVIFFVWLTRQRFTKPFTHALYLRLPFFRTISRNKNLFQFSQVLGTLLKSGVNIDEAIEVTAESMDNYYFKKCLLNARKQLLQGEKLSAILEENSQYFPRLTISLVRVGEKSGRLEEELGGLAENYNNEVDYATKRLTVAIEPMLLIFIGLVVGVLALAIITPIYKVTGNIYR